MNTFSANFSSSPPSRHFTGDTPQKRSHLFSSAEPSTTPAAPPPSSIFGSSSHVPVAGRLQIGRVRDGADAPTNHDLFSFAAPKSGARDTATNNFGLSARSFTTSMNETYEDDMVESSPAAGPSGGFGSAGMDHIDERMSAPSLLRFSTNGNGRQSRSRQQNRKSRSRLPNRGKEDIIPRLARDLTRNIPSAALTESDSTLLDTEHVMRQLDTACQESQNDIEDAIVIAGAAQELLTIWRKGVRTSYAAPLQGHIGPAPSEPPYSKAQFITTLLLELYYPRAQSGDAAMLREGFSQRDIRMKARPEILLAWMNEHHNTFGSLLDSVLRQSPNPTASEFFWDTVHTLVSRGRLTDLMRLLADVDFKYAVIDTTDGFKPANFSGVQLQAIQAAVFQVRQVINECPGLQENDWLIDGQDWDVYRKHVEEAVERMAELADEYGDREGDSLDSSTLSSRPDSHAGLPFSVYEGLMGIYNILLGDTHVILGVAQDWLEATLLLTIWWNGSEEAKVAQWSFDVSRASQPDTPASTGDSYFRRLKESFLCVTDPSTNDSFRINTMSPVEVAIGSVLQGDIPSFLRIVQTMSLCISSAMAELCTWSGLPNLITSADGLDQQDLVVLNYGSDQRNLEKDDILLDYARALFEKDSLVAADGTVFSGWEIAFSVTSRIDDTVRIETTISGFLGSLPVTDPATAEKLIAVCTDLGLAEQSCKVSETFGDHLMNTSAQYGTALLCYARAHSAEKVRQLVDLLNSYCLVQSRAYPNDSDMDDHLCALVGNPRSALTNIFEVDPVAAEALQYYLVGYACIRRFYSIRDEGGQHQEDKALASRPLFRKKGAAKALVAAINSAADSIYGGLYDSTRPSAIQVDGLLPLLGEATALLSDDATRRTLTSGQMYAILAAIEDLEMVGGHIFRATEDCMVAALRNFQGSAPPSPHAMLKKSVSSGNNSNFSFSMMGSEMLSTSRESLGGKSWGSAVIIGNAQSDHSIDADRGWDWRARFNDRDVTATDVLRFLRIGIAKELSLATLEAAE